MCLNNKRLFLFLLGYLVCFAVRSQTLYWVGGDGNFTDAKHWSFTPGGPSANTSPGPNSDLVFYNIDPNLKVTFNSRSEVNSVSIQSAEKITFAKTLSPGRLVIKSKFDDPNNYKRFNSEIILEFSNTGATEGYINTGFFKLNGDVMITSGKWRVGTIYIDNDHGLYITKADVKFIFSFVEVGHLDLYDCGFLKFDHNCLKVQNETKVKNCDQYSFKRAFMNWKTYYDSIPNGGLPSIAERKGSTQQIMAACTMTIDSISKPTCSPGCDAIAVITLPPSSCGSTLPYQLLVSSNGCPGSPASISPANPGTYTLTGFCYCTYGVILDDNSGNGDLDVQPIPVQNPIILTISNGISNIKCGGACTGSFVINNNNGTPPYQYTVSPPSPAASYTAAGTSSITLNVTGLCAGITTVAISDQNSCFNTVTRNFIAPASLNTNSVLTNEQCFGNCTGSLSISPTGGVAPYSVTFTPGSILPVSAGGTVSATGLCTVAISATLKDANSCSVTVSGLVTQPPAITVTASQNSVNCYGACTGSASIQTTGGVAPYSFTLTSSVGTVSSVYSSTFAVNLTSLCPGTYTAVGRDNNNCTIPTQTFTIKQPPVFNLVPTFTNSTCNGLPCNGAISLSPTGGNGPAYSYSWSTGSTSSSLTALCANSYTVAVKDGSSCATTSVFPITQPPPFTVTAVSQSIACFGSCNGGATVTASGSNGSYTYSWSPTPPSGQGTAIISNLCGGTSYTAAIKDGSNCATAISISVTPTSSITPNMTTTSVTCNSFCNGSITAAPTVPTGPSTFNYTLASISGTTLTPPPYTGLCAGNYTLYIQNLATGCTQAFTTAVQQPNLLTGSIGTTSVTCFNKCNGTLSGIASGGTPVYTFVWTTPTGTVAGSTLNGQCVGSYALLITDVNSCTVSASATITQPSSVTISISSTSVTCFSAGDGALAALIGGGTPGYTLSWSNGSGSNPDINLPPGTYTLLVTDANTCTQTAIATVAGPSSVTLTQSTTPVSCSGGSSGSATVVASGGTPPYLYTFNTSPVTLPITTNATGIVSGLPQGNYQATVKDFNNCSRSIFFTITQPTALSAAITGSANSCNACTGAATVTGSGGTAPYSYVWTNTLNATVATASVASSLCPGNYTVTITDNNLCTASATVHISLTVNITIVAGGSGILCYGACTGVAVANPSGGTPAYSYTWTNSSGTSVSTSSTAASLCAGTYSILVKDALGCTAIKTTSVTQPSSLTVVSSQTNATCPGFCDAVISTTVTGGTSPIFYTWSNGSITSSITNVCAGTYSLQIHDQNLCNAAVQNFTIAQNTPITAVITTTNPSTCVLSNGNICVSASGGNGGPYSYTWSPVAGNLSCLGNLSAGAYVVSISDGVCTATFNAVLTNPAGPSLAVTTQSVACFGGATGAATVTATGVSPFTFTWSPFVGAVSGPTSSIASGLSGGSYIITAKDSFSCATSQTVNIAQSLSLTVNSTVSNITCNGTNNGSITLAPIGGTPTYSYTWLPGGLTGGLTGTVTNLSAGGYTATVTDTGPCTYTYAFIISTPAPLTMTTLATNVDCNAACDGSIAATASGGTGGVSYTWTPVGTFPGAATGTIVNLCANTYVVKATDLAGCTVSNTVLITEPTALVSTLNLQNASCSNSCNAVATLSVTGGIPTYSFSWSTGSSITATLSGLCAGNYTGTVIDGNGCAVANGFTVTPPAPFTVSLTGSSPLCNAICSGSILTVLSGAQGTVNYNWSPSGAGQNPTSLCFGSYTLTATDNQNCVAQDITVLSDPPAVFANVTTINAACSNSCNGVANSNPLNATGTVSYTWTPAGPTGAGASNWSNICNGNYTVQLTDGLGCQALQTFTLVNPPALVINPALSPASCSLSNGMITANVSGGTPLYTYNWLPPAVSNTDVATNLGAGIYSLTVTDNNGCSTGTLIPLSNANGPGTAPIVSASISCYGLCTGAASIDVIGIAGGTPSYNVSWLPPASSSNPLTNLCAGNYIAQITDLNSCVLFTTSTIGQPPAILLSPTFGLPSCNGICDGSLSLNPSGGIGPGYSYTWVPSGPSGPTLLNACAGTYNILVQDGGNLCVYSETVVLPAQLNIIVSTNVVNNNCFGDCNGSSTAFNAQGGQAPYTFNWSNGQSGATATNLCNGTYTLLVTDANGCSNAFPVVITSLSQLTASAAINSPSCGVCNGSSTITASGGPTPYNYLWSAGSTFSTASNLCAGLYQVLVSDQLGCKQTETVIVNNSNGITGDNPSIQPLTCSGLCDGAATVTAVGGNGTITYNWISPVVSGPSISNVCAGTYFVQMTDATGCLRTSSVTINPITTLTLSPFITQPGCGQFNGAIDVLIAGGTQTYSVVWSPNVGNTATVTGISQGIYTITVTDSSSPNACSQTQQINVSNTTGPSVSVTQANINCFNACTGSITATATGAAPLTYSWNTGSTSPSLTNLCKGPLTLAVTDGNNCVTINSYSITDIPQLQAGIPSILQPSCNLCNGTASLNIFGGTLPYTYTWTNGSTGSGISSLCAGIYQVKVLDNVGCQQTETVIINNSNGITGENLNVQGLPCNGTCNGSATVSAVGGNPPYVYNWINPATTNSVITNLCAGTYFVQMNDAQGCIRSSSVDVNALTIITLTASIVPPGCSQSNGAISILIAGGTPSYGVVWTPTASISQTLSGISQGTYSVTVTENGPNKCSLTQAFNVSNSSGPLVSATQTNISCFNTCTGILSAVAGGTASPFTYNWNVGGNASTITNLCKGIVTLSVTDASNCVTIQSYTVTDNPQLLPGVPTITQPVCNKCNGVASINALGGALPYTYSWTTGTSGNSVSNLCAGLYQVEIIDNLGCQQTQDIIINNSNGIGGGTFSVKDESCAGNCNGSATVSAIGGAAPITYNWLNPPVTNPAVNNLCAGTYFVQMTDANGCILTASAAVNSTPSFSYTAAVTTPSCNTADGSIAVTVSGAISPQYSWSPVASTASSLTNIGAGSYTLLLSDASGCSQTQVFDISNSTAPAITYTQNNIACFNACTGSIIALASGSVAPFGYAWSMGTAATPSIVTGLCKGLVTLTVRSQDGCKALHTFTITDNPALNLSLPNYQLPSCNSNCDGAITLLPSGASLPYLYSWAPSGGSSNPQTALCAGNYSVTITDGKGCVNSTTVALNGPVPLQVTANFNNSSCSSAADGSIGISATGGSGSYTYSWTASGAFASGSQNITNLLSGTYSLTISDSQGCKNDTTLKLVPTITVTAQAGRDTVVCAAAPVVLNGANSIGASQFEWFQLPNTAALVASTSSFVISSAAVSGTYVLMTVASVSTCYARDTVVVNVFPDIYVDAGPSVTIPVFSSVTIGGNPTIETSVTLTWTPAGGLSDPTVQNPVATNTLNTTYTVTVTDVNGCMASDTVQVLLYPEIKFPNGFTPNGDGKNDAWVIDYIDQFPNNEVEVYNRWGEQLFYSKGYAVPFNGTYHGKDLPVGTYYYIIHLNHPAYTKAYTGPLTIFR